MAVFSTIGPREKRLDAKYSVREDGVVLSDGFPLKAIGGIWVSLHGDRRLVSYLVARAFVPNAEGRRYVVHKNGNKRDNRASNLEWSDSEEKSAKRGPKPRVCVVGQFSVEGDMVARYGSVVEAAEACGLNARNVRAALARKGQTGGYYWLYL